MDQMVRFLRSPSITGSGSTPSSVRNSKVAYALCNSLGSIVLVGENRRVVRKANVINHVDIRLTNALEYLEKFVGDPAVTIRLATSNTTVVLMYCHRSVEKIRAHCREVTLTGRTLIVFADHRFETPEVQDEHSRLCNCGHICYSNPPSFALSHGDLLRLKGGAFYLRACSEAHCIYITKSEFKSQIEFVPGTPSGDIEVHPLLAFVDSLPDSPAPLIT